MAIARGKAIIFDFELYLRAVAAALRSKGQLMPEDTEFAPNGSGVDATQRVGVAAPYVDRG